MGYQYQGIDIKHFPEMMRERIIAVAAIAATKTNLGIVGRNIGFDLAKRPSQVWEEAGLGKGDSALVFRKPYSTGCLFLQEAVFKTGRRIVSVSLFPIKDFYHAQYLSELEEIERALGLDVKVRPEKKGYTSWVDGNVFSENRQLKRLSDVERFLFSFGVSDSGERQVLYS